MERLNKTIAAALLSLSILCWPAFTAALSASPESDRSGWVPIRFEVSPAVGEMNWSVLWRIYAYQKPDRFCGQRGVFVNRHVNPFTGFDLPPAVTRDSKGMDQTPSGAQVSIAALPGGELYAPGDNKTAHQRDWDFIAAETGRLLAERGLDKSADRLSQIKALAEYVQSRRGGEVYESRGPADFLIHSSYCTGAANAMAGIAAVLGLEYRTINHYGHSVSEVLLDGKWYFIENSVGWPVFVPTTLMRLTCDPEAYPYDKQKYGTRYVEWDLSGNDWMHYGAVYTLSSRWWHFNQGSLGADQVTRSQALKSGCGVCVGLDGNTARPLYPGLKEYLFKATDNEAMLLTGKYCWYFSYLPLGAGQGVRRSFYLGRLDDPEHPVTAVKAQLVLHPGSAGKFPSDGQGWLLYVNGQSYPLEKKQVSWTIVRKALPVPEAYTSNPAGLLELPEEYLEFDLPLQALKAASLNTVELACPPDQGDRRRRSTGVQVRLFPDPVAPYQDPLYTGPGQRLPQRWTVNPDHICEVLRVGGWEYGGTPFISSTPAREGLLP